MTAKKSAEVIIDGKVYTLSGYEEEGLSGRRWPPTSIIKSENCRRWTVIGDFLSDTKATLVELNIADDYFKARGSDRGVGAYPGAEGEGDLRSEA